MKLIVGLGNPDPKYQQTRHNLGWRVVHQLAWQYKALPFKQDKRFMARLVLIILNQEKTILAQPSNYMNNSGQSVKAIADYYKILPADILVVHDDVDLNLGEIRLQKNRGAAGHKGVQSIIDQLKTKDFSRLRLGIAPTNREDIQTEKFVLENFSKAEETIVNQLIKKATAMITEAF